MASQAAQKSDDELGPESIRRIRGTLSQASFARIVGVTPLTVYRWELPDGAPEARRPRGRTLDAIRRVAAGDRAPPPEPVAAAEPPEDEEEEDDRDAAAFAELVAASPAMQRVLQDVRHVAATRATVIVLGESGTGKELVARAIHALSPRADAPFSTLNCAAVPRELFEGQLFGYRRGAFTGAAADFPGVALAAEGGSLFLDEIAELPLELQPKLLRFLENGEIHPLGQTQPTKIDVRLIAATHRDLEARVESGSFREDLYYRLNVLPLRIPPLRERPEDILALARHFLELLAPPGEPPRMLSEDAAEALLQHAWPGNARELRNAIERSLAFAPHAQRLTTAELRIQA